MGYTDERRVLYKLSKPSGWENWIFVLFLEAKNIRMKSKKRKYWNKLKNRYKLTIFNESTYEESRKKIKNELKLRIEFHEQGNEDPMENIEMSSER